MGSSHSKPDPYADLPLTSYTANPMAIVDHAHVHAGPDPLPLYLHPEPSFSESDFTISDSQTNAILYHAEGRAFSVSGKVTLSDTGGNALCNFKDTSTSSNLCKYTVYRGASSGQGPDHGVAMTMRCHEAKKHFELEVQTGTGDVVYVITSEWSKWIHVFNGHPTLGGYLVARTAIRNSDKMHAEVAPGVDVVAVVSLLLIATEVRWAILNRTRNRGAMARGM